MIQSNKVHEILYGGDYNPEQWGTEELQKDMEYLPQAGVNIVTLNVFNWAMIQPDETHYDFSGLDETVRMVTEKKMKICMATATGAHPAWMAHRHPDILRTEFNGMKRKFGGRHNSCPNSPTFHLYSVRLAAKLAEHYRNQDNIVAWHIGNEYGGICYCENCEKAFRIWLQKKYGTLEKLNQVWNTHFWGHTFYDWDEIVAPNLLTEHFESNRSMFPCITLDYYRFYSDSLMQNFIDESEEIRKIIPDAKITTNLMGFYKELDYGAWAKHMDFISWDNYPNAGEPEAMIGMKHDLMRGLKPGMPFALMEQTPSVSNWHNYATLKRPGEMRLMSYQAMAHGADTIMFFQMRQCRAECEKLHSAFISHVGTNDTRIYRECKELGQELHSLGDELIGSRVPAKAAILFDWNNWWAIEMSAGLNMDLHYLDELYCYYEALHAYGVQVDVIGTDAPLDDYRLVIAPTLYMVKPGVSDRLSAFTEQGGTLVLSIYSGMADENDNVTQSGYPGELRKLCGLWIEEFDSLPSGECNHFTWDGQRYTSELMFALSHPEGAQTLAGYETDFYQGMPVLSVHHTGKGQVYYFGTRSEKDFYHAFTKKLCTEQGLLSQDAKELPEGLELSIREKDGVNYLFFLNHLGEENHTARENSICLTDQFAGTSMLSGRKYCGGEKLTLPPYGVELLRQG